MTEIKLISETENPLFLRKEMKFEMKADAMPSHGEVKKLISEKFSLKPELMRTNKISGKFGSNVFEVTMDVYSSDAEFKRVVNKTKQEIEKEKKAFEEKKKAEAEAKKAAEEAKKAAEAATNPEAKE